jgi:hypothetical protein
LPILRASRSLRYVSLARSPPLSTVQRALSALTRLACHRQPDALQRSATCFSRLTGQHRSPTRSDVKLHPKIRITEYAGFRSGSRTTDTICGLTPYGQARGRGRPHRSWVAAVFERFWVRDCAGGEPAVRSGSGEQMGASGPRGEAQRPSPQKRRRRAKSGGLRQGAMPHSERRLSRVQESNTSWRS